MRAALLDIPHGLIDQRELEELAAPYYHSRLRGGEGHLEVGKNIYYHVHHLAHMVLSLKPFGCMPSTQSDAVQASARREFGDMIFLPVETSGEGRSRLRRTASGAETAVVPRAAEPGNRGRRRQLRVSRARTDGRDLSWAVSCS
jgi:hypothetical protein